MGLLLYSTLSVEELCVSRELQRDLFVFTKESRGILWHYHRREHYFGEFRDIVIPHLLSYCSDYFLQRVRSVTDGHSPGIAFEYAIFESDADHLYWFSRGIPIKLPACIRQEDILTYNNPFNDLTYTFKLLSKNTVYNLVSDAH